jgi:RimJ/RimL family protein N-acetyltransferase
MPYTVTAQTLQEKAVMLQFMHDHGVCIPFSEETLAFGSVSSREDKLIGVVTFQGFVGRTCTLHVAGDGNWLTRHLIWQTFNTAFRLAGLLSIIAPVAGNNARALEFDKRLGFKEVHRVIDGWADGVDLIFLELKRQDCVWLAKFDTKFAH